MRAEHRVRDSNGNGIFWYITNGDCYELGLQDIDSHELTRRVTVEGSAINLCDCNVDGKSHRHANIW